MAPKAKTLYLLRHGQVDGPAALYGKTDVPALASENTRIIHFIQTALFSTASASENTQVVSSPLQRCYHLATALVEAIGASQLALSPDLHEMNFGQLDGVAFDRMKTNGVQWQAVENFYHDPFVNTPIDAESLSCFHARVKQGINDVIKTLLAGEQQQMFVVVHGGVIRMALAILLELDWRKASLYRQLNIEYGSLTKITFHGFDSSPPSHRVDYIGRPCR